MVEGKAGVGQVTGLHAESQEIERAEAGLTEEVVALGRGTGFVIHWIVIVAETGSHVMSQQDALGIGEEDKLFIFCQVGQNVLPFPSQCLGKETDKFAVVGKLE